LEITQPQQVLMTEAATLCWVQRPLTLLQLMQ